MKLLLSVFIGKAWVLMIVNPLFAIVKQLFAGRWVLLGECVGLCGDARGLLGHSRKEPGRYRSRF